MGARACLPSFAPPTTLCRLFTFSSASPTRKGRNLLARERIHVPRVKLARAPAAIRKRATLMARRIIERAADYPWRTRSASREIEEDGREYKREGAAERRESNNSDS